MAPLKKMFSHDVVTHKMTILVMAPLNLENFVRVQDYAGRVMASPCSHSGDCSRHKKRAARNGDSPLQYASECEEVSDSLFRNAGIVLNHK